MNINFDVAGIPQPQGSTRAFVTRAGKAVTTSANKNLKPWRQELATMAMLAVSENNAHPVTSEAVHVKCIFYFQKPKSTKKSVVQKLTKPDLDKLIRAALDGMTGICYRDDSQVVGVEAYKLFADYPHTHITVENR